MVRLISFATILLCIGVSPAFSQRKVKPNINRSKEYPNVFHSPSADATPEVFRSVFQMEVVVRKVNADAEVMYANGTAVSADGLVVAVLDQPRAKKAGIREIVSASILLLDGVGIPATLVKYEPTYGVAVFRVKGLECKPLPLNTGSPVAGRRANWYAVFKNGNRTYLYTRPVRIHTSSFQMGEIEDLCQIIDSGTSSLNADRSGSALISLDGRLLAIMGRQDHWNVTPKNSPPRKKLSWAVPAHVIGRLLGRVETESDPGGL